MEVRFTLIIVVLAGLLIVVVIERGVVVAVVMKSKIRLVVSVVDHAILDERPTSRHRPYSAAAAIERR
jgi:hypothetical protein